METRIAIAFTVLGCLTRVLFLDTHPNGFDTDESFILYWGRKLLLEKQFYTFAPEFTRWEMIPSYLFGAFSFLSTRWLRAVPVAMNFVEMALLWLVVRRGSDKRAAWIATALFSTCPWSLYYSRILGTCTGVGIFTLLAFQGSVRHPIWLVMSHTLGLLYYTTYRLMFGFVFLCAIVKKQVRGIQIGFAAGIATLGLVAISKSSVVEFFTRGQYNVVGVSVGAKHYLYSLVAPFVPVLSAFRQTTTTFMADYVHAGFATAIGWHAPLGWGFSALVIFSLYALFQRREAVETNAMIRKGLLFLGVCYLSLGFMGPSFSRFLIVVPFLAMLAGGSWKELSLGERPRIVLLCLILGSGTVAQVRVLETLGDEKQMEAYFHSRFQHLAEFVGQESSASAANTFLISDYGYPSARLWADLSDAYTVLPAVTPETLRDVMRFAARNRSQYLLIDSIPEVAETLSGYDKHTRIQRARLGLLEHVVLEEQRDVYFSGTKIGELWKIRWPS